MSINLFSKPAASGLSQSGGAPKVLGADVELGNFVLGLARQDGTGATASRMLWREIDGLPWPALSHADSKLDSIDLSQPISANPQDWGRKYLPANGGCVYIDLDHLEWCTPEVLSAYDFAAACHAMLRIVRSALQAANVRLPKGLKLVAVVNNQDGQGHSYGSHLSVLVNRGAWNRLFHRRLHQLLMLASFQVSSIILTGQGKVNSQSLTTVGGNGCYEISQRASFFECLVGPQTTYNRPLVNSRDEALCGRFTELGCSADRFARLHSIFFDSTLCPASIVLRAGMMQIMLSLLEQGEIDGKLKLILEDPVETVARYSHDPSLTARASLVTGEQVTALELQRRFFDLASTFVDGGSCEGMVPQAREILDLWADTLDKLSRKDFAALAPRLDWVLKLQLLERAMQKHPELDWDSPEIKHLDFKYADLEEGLFWVCNRAGAVETVGVTDERIAEFTSHPPPDTRAWARSELLRLADPETVVDVDWDRITFRLHSLAGVEIRRTVGLANPIAFTKKDTEVVFRHSEDLKEALDLLGAPASDSERVSVSSQYCHLPNHPGAKATNPLSIQDSGPDRGQSSYSNP